MPDRFDTLIVGGGQAGAQTAIALRQNGFAGSIAIVGDEPDPPYERPPLSKDYLSGATPFDRMLIRPNGFWAEQGITLIAGHRVDAVDPQGHGIVTDRGAELGYGTLVWAAGGAPRRLACEGSDLQGVHTLRTRADADRLIAELPAVRTALVVGGGYIGLEAAAMLTQAGKRVVLVEALDRVLDRVAGVALSRFFEAEHRAHGVDLRTGIAADRIDGDGMRVTGVRLSDGTQIAAEMVIVGIGIVPAVAPLLAAGARGGNGVTVDSQCRTSLADIFAVGDCAEHPSRFADGAHIRLESVQNANDQAMVAARTICGLDAEYQALPWFWSNQYDLRLQTVGLSAGHDRAIVRGDPAARSFSIVYLRGGRVVALDCINAPRDFARGRKLVLDGAIVDPAMIADPQSDLKHALA